MTCQQSRGKVGKKLLAPVRSCLLPGQVTVQVATMTHELSKKSKEIRKYHAEQAVVFNRIRELVGHPREIVNKARLYDQMMDSGEPASARQTIPILVRYSRMMKDLLAGIQKVVRLSGTPRRVRYQGPLGSPTKTLYKVVGEVALVRNLWLQGPASREAALGLPVPKRSEAPERTRSSQVRRKHTGSIRSGRGQSHVPRTSDWSWTPDGARTL